LVKDNFQERSVILSGILSKQDHCLIYFTVCFKKIVLAVNYAAVVKSHSNTECVLRMVTQKNVV